MAEEDLFLKDQLIDKLRVRLDCLDKKHTKLSIKYDDLVRKEQKLSTEQ